jgi:riboflavin biosynthesis pyrimidine reductase
MTAIRIRQLLEPTSNSVNQGTDTTSGVDVVPQRDIDPMEAITREDRASSRAGRPWVYVNMVSSIDGATAVEGVSGALGGPADQLVFSALRAQADVIVAGAQTVRAEDYRPPQTHPEVQRVRLARGQSAKPLIVVVTASASVTPDMGLFDDPDYIPILVTGSDASPERLAALGGKARIIRQPSPTVDLSAMLDMLGSEGHKKCLVEGGPSLNGQFVSEGLVDEWNMTLSPILASGNSSRPAHGPATQEGQRLDLVRLWLADGLLFGRWIRGTD